MNPAGGDVTVGLALALRARINDVQNQTFTYADDTGTANAYVVTLAPGLSSYAAGQQVTFLASTANSGPSTINVNSLGVVSLVKDGSVALSGGEIAAGQIIYTVFDGTNFQLVGSSGGGGGTITLTGDVTGSGTSSIATTIAATGVTAGTYPKVTVNAKGQVTAGTTLSPSDIPSGYTGGTSIDTVGTITTGTWEGTDVGAAYGGTGLSGPYSVGDILVATGTTTLTNFGVGTNNKLIVADSTQTAGMRWANTMFGIGGGVFLPNAKYVQKQVLNAASGNNDIAAPASGKRWFIVNILCSNPTGSTISAYPTFKNGGTYYQFQTSQTVAAGGYGETLDPRSPILESSDTLSVHCSAAGLSIFAWILEFDTTSTFKTVKTLSLGTGNNTLYTAPSGASAYMLGNEGLAGLFPGLAYWNFSGANRTVYWNAVLSGGSVVAPGTSGTNAMSVSSTVSTGSIFQFYTAVLNSGDFINLHVDSGAATQYAYVTVVEWTT